MSDQKPSHDERLTPAGEVELNEEELDQVAGGSGKFEKVPGSSYTQYDGKGGKYLKPTSQTKPASSAAGKKTAEKKGFSAEKGKK